MKGVYTMENNKPKHASETSSFNTLPFNSLFIISMNETIILFLLKWAFAKHVKEMSSAGVNCLFTLFTLLLVYLFVVRPAIYKDPDADDNNGGSLFLAIIATGLVVVVPFVDIISLFLH